MEKKLEWGEAKKQVLSLWPEIGPALEKGATVRSLFNSLTEAGKIEMSERPFYRIIKHLRSNSRPNLPPPSPPAKPPSVDFSALSKPREAGLSGEETRAILKKQYSSEEIQALTRVKGDGE